MIWAKDHVQIDPRSVMTPRKADRLRFELPRDTLFEWLIVQGRNQSLSAEALTLLREADDLQTVGDGILERIFGTGSKIAQWELARQMQFKLSADSAAGFEIISLPWSVTVFTVDLHRFTPMAQHVSGILTAAHYELLQHAELEEREQGKMYRLRLETTSEEKE